MFKKGKRIFVLKPFSLGLRTRLLLLVLFAVIPAFGLIGYTAISQRQQAAVNAERDAMNLVRLAAREQSRLIAGTRQLLLSLSKLPEVRQPLAGAACGRILAELRKPHPYYTNLGVAAPDGRLFCSAQAFSKPVNIADRNYFRRAVQSRDFGVGDYQIGRVTRTNTINFGQAILDARGNLQALVYAALDLGWLNQLITDVEMPKGSVLLVVDSGGTVLARYPESDKWVGKSIRDSTLVKTILNHRYEGTTEIEDLDGVERLYAFAPLHDSPTGNVYVSMGISKAVAFAAADKDFARNLTLLLLVAMLALIVAWGGSNAFVLRRVTALATAARRLGEGDLHARTGLPHGTEELGQLARSFDNMAQGLQLMATARQRVNRALKALSAGNRAMARATDEPTLLTEMCRAIVEAGGYRFAWIGYAEHDEHKTVRPMARAGFEDETQASADMAGDIVWADTERGRGPAGTAIRTVKPYVAHNFLSDPNLAPWRQQARRCGYASAAAFPLCVQGKVIGALSIYSEEADAFDAEELELLAEAAQDLAFGITMLRTRDEHDRTLEHLAYFDSLTGLPNRMHFEERLRRDMSEASVHGQSLALIIIDLNRLWEINDALGFHQGDQLLKDVSTRIRQVLKEEEALVARMRGDEFAVLLPVSDTDHATMTVQRILQVLGTPFTISDLKLEVSATMGVSLFPQHGAEAAHLLRHADVAMHQAKKSGKDYVFYAAEYEGDSTRRLALAGELRHAIEAGELVLYYQPKIDMRSGTVCGVEALVRWQHPQRGMIPPDEFIPLAEHSGLIKPLTDWVVNAALRQSSLWRQSGSGFPIAVNLSARSLRDAELSGKMEHLLATCGAEASWIELELTEGAVMEDPEGALVILKRLSGLGIKLFIDDFGTGYSSLGYLKRLPMDAVKIDKSFVIDMLTNADSAAIVRSTISLAHDLDLKVVAEGVESQAILDRLGALGCDVVQGYYLGKPLPAEQCNGFKPKFYTRRWPTA